MCSIIASLTEGAICGGCVELDTSICRCRVVASFHSSFMLYTIYTPSSLMLRPCKKYYMLHQIHLYLGLAGHTHHRPLLESLLCLSDLINGRLLGGPPNHPWTLNTLPQRPLDDNVLLHLPNLSSSWHNRSIGSVSSQLLLRTDSNHSLSDTRSVNHQTRRTIAHDLGALGVLDNLPLPSLALWTCRYACNKGVVESTAAYALQCWDVLLGESGIH